MFVGEIACPSPFSTLSFSLQPQNPLALINPAAEQVRYHLASEHRLLHDPFDVAWLDAAVPDAFACQRVSLRGLVPGERGWDVQDDVAGPLVAADVGYQADVDVEGSRAGLLCQPSSYERSLVGHEKAHARIIPALLSLGDVPSELVPK